MLNIVLVSKVKKKQDKRRQIIKLKYDASYKIRTMGDNSQMSDNSYTAVAMEGSSLLIDSSNETGTKEGNNQTQRHRSNEIGTLEGNIQTQCISSNEMGTLKGNSRTWSVSPYSQRLFTSPCGCVEGDSAQHVDSPGINQLYGYNASSEECLKTSDGQAVSSSLVKRCIDNSIEIDLDMSVTDETDMVEIGTENEIKESYTTFSQPMGLPNSKIVKIIKTSKEDIFSGKSSKYSKCSQSYRYLNSIYKHMKRKHKESTIHDSDGEVIFHVPETSTGDNLISKGNKFVKVSKTPFEKIKEGKGQYKCLVCDQACNRLNSLYSSVKIVPETCKIYNALISIQRNIVQIINTPEERITKGEKKYKCSECDQMSNIHSRICLHMRRKHRGFIIINAKGQATLSEDVNLHVSKRSDNGALNSESNNDIVQVINTPLERINKGEKKYKCSQCGHSCNILESLYRHMSRMHKGFKIHHKQTTIMSPTTPQVVHDQLRKLEGLGCALKSQNISDVTVSQRKRIVKCINTPFDELKNGKDRHRCSECDYTSNFHSNLYRHMKKMHKRFTIANAKGEVKLQGCVEKQVPETCNDKPLNSTNEHVVQGTNIVQIINTPLEDIKKGEKKYKCSQCGQSSNFLDILYMHMSRMHSRFEIQSVQAAITSTTSQVIHDQLCERKLERPGCGLQSQKEDAMISQCKGIVECINTPIEELKNGKDRYRCSGCNYTSNFHSCLYRHMKKIHKGFTIVNAKGKIKLPRSIKKQVAEICNYMPLNSASKHVIQGWVEKQASETCLPLNSSNKHVVQLIKTPLEGIKKGEKRFRCSECGQAYDFHRNIYTHMRSKHKGYTILNAKGKVMFQGDNNLCGPETALNSSRKKIVQLVNTPLERINSGYKKYSCSECDKTSDNCKKIYLHMRRKHRGFTILNAQGVVKLHVPETCSDNAENSSSSNFINVAVMVQSYECCVCMEMFQTCDDLDKHVRIHEEKISENSEQIAENEDDTVSTLKKIVKIVNTQQEEIKKGEKRYRCSECGQTYNHLRVMYRHMKRKHKGFTVEKVKDLLKNNRQSSYFHRQQRRQHTRGKIDDMINSFGDKVVQVVANSEDGIKRGEKSYKCSKCNQACSFLNSMYRHMRRKHKGFLILNSKGQIKYPVPHTVYNLNQSKINCDTGEQEYLNLDSAEMDTISRGTSVEESMEENDLETCKKGKSKTSPVFPSYECSICMETFVSLNDLNLHVEIHEGENPNEDSEIGTRQTKSVKVIKASIEEIERGEKQYKCSECNQTSNFSNSLRRHMKKKHKGFLIQSVKDQMKYSVPHTMHQLNQSKNGGDFEEQDISNSEKYFGEQEIFHSDSTKTITRAANTEECVESDHCGTSEKSKPDMSPVYQCYECSVCMEAFRSLSDLDLHVKIHEGDKSREDSDPIGFTTESRTQQTKVIKVINTSFEEIQRGVKLYKCSGCNQSSNFLSLLYKHMKIAHKGIKIYYPRGMTSITKKEKKICQAWNHLTKSN